MTIAQDIIINNNKTLFRQQICKKKLIKPNMTKTSQDSQGYFYNILSDCHKSDEIYYLLNAFRLEKKLFNYVFPIFSQPK